MKHNTTSRDYSPAMLPGMGAPVFGGVSLTPLDLGKPYTGPADLWAKYNEDGQEGPGLFAELDYDNREGRG
jgi:hypothetical protein